jgi:cell wall-associated NlpC family hydrolase
MEKYLFLQHNYDDINCVTLIQQFYKEELGLELVIPEYEKSRRWSAFFTTESVDSWAKNNAKKVELTEAKNYDLIIFKSRNSNKLTHFAMYIESNRMLHVEENSTSKIEILSDYWLQQLYGVYRHAALVL